MLLAIGNDLLVSWKDGTTYGVDKISWTAKYSGAYIETIVISGSREKEKTFEEFALTYKENPTNCALTLAYYANNAGSATSITLTEDTDNYKYYALQDLPIGEAKFKIGFTVSGNTASELAQFYVLWNEEDVI
jgi:hypothetical protein